MQVSRVRHRNRRTKVTPRVTGEIFHVKAFLWKKLDIVFWKYDVHIKLPVFCNTNNLLTYAEFFRILLALFHEYEYFRLTRNKVEKVVQYFVLEYTRVCIPLLRKLFGRCVVMKNLDMILRRLGANPNVKMNRSIFFVPLFHSEGWTFIYFLYLYGIAQSCNHTWPLGPNQPILVIARNCSWYCRSNIFCL